MTTSSSYLQHKLSGKASCMRCWQDSNELCVDYLEMLKENHHSELVRAFSHDRCLEMQRQSLRPVHKGRKAA